VAELFSCDEAVAEPSQISVPVRRSTMRPSTVTRVSLPTNRNFVP
jgi:hypothetical protein